MGDQTSRLVSQHAQSDVQHNVPAHQLDTPTRAAGHLSSPSGPVAPLVYGRARAATARRQSLHW